MGHHDGQVADEPHRKIGIFRNTQLLQEVRFVELGLIFLRAKQAVEPERASAQTLILDRDRLILHILKEQLHLQPSVIKRAIEYREDKVLFPTGVQIGKYPSPGTTVIPAFQIPLPIGKCLSRIGKIRKRQNLLLFAGEKLINIQPGHEIVGAGAVCSGKPC